VRLFRDLSLPRKLTLVMVLVSGTTLVAGTALVTGYQAFTLRDHAVRDEAARAEMIGVSVRAALDFADARTATETLATLESRPEILAAAIYLPDGQLFASYSRGGAPSPRFPELEHETSRFENGCLDLFHDIRDKSGVIGAVFVRRDLHPLYLQLQAAGVIVAGIVLLLMLVAFWLAARLQRIVTDPILRLAAAAHAVTRRQDYGVRVEKSAEDEIGRLTDAFNEMLDAVQARDSAIAASEERFRQLVEHASDGIFISNQDGVCQDVNSHGARMLGGERREFSGVHVSALVGAEHHAELQAAQEIVHDGGTVLREWQFVRLDGSRFPGEISVRLLPDGRVLGILRDVTERKRLEQDLMQAQKLEVLGRLAGGVAHDFNNVLTAIMGFAELMRANSSADDEYPKQISAAAARGASLTRQLLGYARRQVAQPVVMNLDEGIERVRDLLMRLLGEDLELVHVRAESLWAVRMDPTQLEQVLINLAVNARDAMPRGGKLTIETSNVEFGAGAPPRAVAGLAPGQYVLLAISDTGEGIPPEVLPHIFEPFFTTKGVGKGTGLGLANCYGVVKQSGGEIVAESHPGRGATFRIFLPRADAPLAPSASDPHPAPLTHGNGTVLVVEDDEPIRRLVVRSLVEAGFKVLEAADGVDALRTSREYPGEIEVVLTDVVMPRMGGTELVAVLRRERPAIRVLYTSGYAEEFFARHGELEPGIELLAKPYTPALLIERVTSKVPGRRPSGSGAPPA
jgi:PAS domain S-box-containing protein